LTQGAKSQERHQRQSAEKPKEKIDSNRVLNGNPMLIFDAFARAAGLIRKVSDKGKENDNWNPNVRYFNDITVKPTHVICVFR
jgi:hypothetical protein